MKAVVAAFNQEKALVGAFSVITNLLMQFGCNFLKHYRLHAALFQKVKDGMCDGDQSLDNSLDQVLQAQRSSACPYTCAETAERCGITHHDPCHD